MSCALANGLGFKVAQESILGLDGSFDESFLAQLEPTRLRKRKRLASLTSDDFSNVASSSSTSSVYALDQISPTKKSKPLNCEPFDVSLNLNPETVAFVVQLLGDESSSGDEEGEFEEFFVQDEMDMEIQQQGIAKLAREIEKEIHNQVGSDTIEEYNLYVEAICDILNVDCVRQFVFSEAISVKVLVDCTISSLQTSNTEVNR